MPSQLKLTSPGSTSTSHSAFASHCACAGYFQCPLDPYAGVRSVLERCMALPAFSETHPLAVKAATGG